MGSADINFYFDPVCPFAWMTSKWVRKVSAQRDYSVDWRFISLRLVNAKINYSAHFPPDYEAGHTAGLKLLRVAAKARADYGREVIGSLYSAFGSHIFEVDPSEADIEGRLRRDPKAFLEPILAQAELPMSLVDGLEEPGWDIEIGAETAEALALTGKDVGTPIIHFQPPTGVAFFGPVISRLPSDDDALRLWDHVIGLASFPGFTEMKRSLREMPQLRAPNVGDGAVGVQEDWHGGSRRQKK